jgi:DNA polymerase III delta' subunit
VINLSRIFGQDAAIGTLQRAYAADRLAHGMIFAGPAGVGKATTALALAAVFLCENPQATDPCQRCESCRVFAAGNHPDHHLVYKELIRIEFKERKAIDLAVKVIRDYLIDPAGRKPVMGRGKVFVVKQAETMNAQAQNALLKTLEEPLGRTLIILLTDQPGALLPTIRSRCQIVRFAALDEKLVQRELEKRGIDRSTAADAAAVSEGSLGVALKWIEDGVIDAARELSQHMDALLAGRPPGDLQDWFKRAADSYAQGQLKRDELSSKDQATREGLALYLRIAASRFRRKLGETADPEELERACAAIDAIVRAEGYLDANVNVALTFQQLAVALEREFLTTPT